MRDALVEATNIKLKRVCDHPILTPNPDVEWEQDAVFNTAAVLWEDKVHLFYRAITHPGWKEKPSHDKYMSCIGHAVSSDGIHFERFDEPVLGRRCEMDGYYINDPQDPRVTQVDGRFYMTYCDWDISGIPTVQICLASSDDLAHWTNHGPIVPLAKFGYNKNAAIFPEKINGRYVMIHRPEPPQCLHETGELDWDIWSKNPKWPGGMRLAYSDDLLNWSYEEDCLMLPRPGSWDCMKIGIAGPPMKTNDGWLVVYHGVDYDRAYRLGIALLDLNDPSIVIKRQAEPILEAELDWELWGDVTHTVFACGNFLKGNELWVYYGGADTVIGVAKANIA